jgi:RNA polymerase sigma-70 factor (ECF subfamily)
MEHIQDIQEIYADFSGKIRAHLAGKVKRKEDIDDLTQEIFIKIHTSLASLKDEKKLAPWIYSLPRKYREPLVLSEIEGVKQKDIAKRMGLSYSGLKSRVQRGREMIKDMFIECCGLPYSEDGKLIGDCIDHENCKICNPPAN